MIALIGSELRRLTARRILRVSVIVVLAITLLTLVRLFTWSTPDTPESRQRRAVEQARENAAACEEARDNGFIPPQASCVERVDPDSVSSEQVDAKDGLGAATTSVVGFGALIAFVIGASYVGADWHAGTMQALLFWEPRRSRVLAAKAIALVSVMTVFLLALWTFTYLGIWLVAATRGSTEGLTGGIHQSNLLSLGRGAVLVGLTALFGYVVAGATRATAAALGGAFAYFVIVENAIRAVRPGWERYLVSRNIEALVRKSASIYNPNSGNDGVFGFDSTFRLSGVRGTVTLAIYLAVLAGAFWLSFSRRDVT